VTKVNHVIKTRSRDYKIVTWPKPVTWP